MRDGDLDNGVIIHEYGHGISNRLTGSSVNCLDNEEQGGEGWSDFFGYMLTMPNGTEPAGGRGMGTYVEGQPTTGPGIRNQKYSTSTSINTETYDTIKTAGGEPHNIGEVWAEMLWEVNYAMIGKYGFDADLINGTAGNNPTLQLVMDGLKLQPCSPGFVDARDAILSADQADYCGSRHVPDLEGLRQARAGLQRHAGILEQRLRRHPGLRPAAGLPRSGNHRHRHTEPGPGRPAADLRDPPAEHRLRGRSGGHGHRPRRRPRDLRRGVRHLRRHLQQRHPDGDLPGGTMGVGATRNCQFKVAIDAQSVQHAEVRRRLRTQPVDWVASHGVGCRDWSLTTTNPHSPTHAAFASDPASDVGPVPQLNPGDRRRR